jgi:hypothetical protein
VSKSLRRADDHIASDGRFRDARFKRQDPKMVEVDAGWSFDRNPFLGQPELSGLKILMTLICNWDIEGERNNRILHVTAEGRAPERWHLVSDLGATFGRMGMRLTNHSKWKLADFQQEGFIDEIDGDLLELDYDGLQSGLERVPLIHARWFARLAAQLNRDQLRRAFGAAGATPAEVEGFSGRMVQKIVELQEAVR